jgi:hypothetical protein
MATDRQDEAKAAFRKFLQTGPKSSYNVVVSKERFHQYYKGIGYIGMNAAAITGVLISP